MKDKINIKPLSEVINFFKKSDKYTIINPNTDLCDIELIGKNTDFSILGIFDYSDQKFYYDNIIQNRPDVYIKQKLTNFMQRYNESYKTNMKKLYDDYDFDIIQLYEQTDFDYIYLLAFIQYINLKCNDLQKKVF
jgi:hypothetical protein